MAQLQVYPFGLGLHNENDSRLQTPGVPRATENLVRTKNGRLVKRRDYETLAMTCQSGVSAMRLFDLAELGGRLFGLGRCTVSLMRAYTSDAIERLFELVEQPTHAWSRVPTGELGAGTHLRKLGRVGRKLISIDQVDVAAGDGLVCLVFTTILNPAAPTTFTVAIVIIDPETDSTITAFQVSSRTRGRVCFVDGSFFVTMVQDSDGSIELYQFNPAAASTLTQLTDIVTAGSAIVAYDLAASLDTDTFWLASVRSNTTTQIRGCDSDGAVTYTTAGPAVLGDAVSVLHHTSGVERLHVAIVRDTTLDVDLHTYLPPATTPAVSTTSIFSESLTQPGLSLTEDGDLLVVLELTFESTVFARGVDVTNHSLGQIWQIIQTRMNGKSFSVLGRPLVPTAMLEDSGFNGPGIADGPEFFTHAVLRIDDLSNGEAFRAVSVTDRFLGHVLNRVHLPSVAYDSSTNLVYVVQTVEDEDRAAAPQVLQMRVAGTDRRQTVTLGDVMYLAGAIVQSFDGKQASEAGGFLMRPTITSMAAAGAGSGDLTSGGIYQAIVVQEYRDTKGRRIQSAPSNLAEAQEGGGTGIIELGFSSGLTLRDSGATDDFTPEALQSPPTNVAYRTLDTNDGNATFHIDVSTPYRSSAIKTLVNLDLTQSDVDISDNSILYSQGARGSLSGPLEFVCPDSAITLSASADRVLTGGLPDDAKFQESRPLFPGEQVQWSDTAGFFREVRGTIRCAARLDERRILFTDKEIFEADGPGLDDNGLGDIGAARRLPSDVGLYGGQLGWRSVVEMSAGLIFQGLRTQLYLLPRGGVTPVAIGFAVEDILDAYPDISAAVYLNEDQTVRFTCNDEAGTESVVLLFNVRFGEWFTEGPYAFGIRSAAKVGGQFVMLTSGNAVMRQRTSDVPLVYVPTAWRSDVLHPFKPGMFGQILAVWFYGRFKGDTRARAVVRFDDDEPVYHEWIEVHGLTVGEQFIYRFEFEATSCESIMVDFEFEALQGQATEAVDYNFFALEIEPSNTPYLIGPESRS